MAWPRKPEEPTVAAFHALVLERLEAVRRTMEFAD
jgi:hypothetical protein